MSPETTARLLGSIHAGRLVIVCGAGLSMAPPSRLPSALRVAEACFDRYRLNIDANADAALRHDLERLAQHFADADTLESVFIETLVPWADFVRPPNAGHAAVADLLVTKAAAAGLSANYDVLIERCAVENGFDFQNSLDGDEATVRARTQAPLLKFHGCATRDRSATVWTPSQLDTGTISERIARSRTWMAANLRQKDLLVVGFWSDWTYLNVLLGEVLDGLSPLSVTVVDPADADFLEEKARELWLLAHGAGVTFEHVQQSGAEALDELRNAFSKNYLKSMLAAGRQAFEETTGVECEPEWLSIDDFDNTTLYGLRRDAEGVPSDKPATRSHPAGCESLSVCHLMLRRAGAVQTPIGYDLGGRAVRVVNGAGAILSKLKSQFAEAPVIRNADIVIAPGAIDLPGPANVVRPGRSGNFIRPASGANWLDLIGAQQELGF